MKLNQIVIALAFTQLFFSCKNNEEKKEATTASTTKITTSIGYEGDDILAKAVINRDKDTKKASLESSLEGDWSIYAGSSVESIDFSKPLLTGKGAGNFPLEVPTDKRIFFEIVTPTGKAIISERHLPMAGGFNFRDIGGYKMQDGKHVKWGKIFRSDDLATLTDADLNYLSSFPLLSDVDYRSKEEIKPAQDKRPKSLKNYLEYNISPGNTNAMMAKLKTATNAAIDSEMMAMNVFFVSDTSAINQFKKMFEHLQNPDGNVPLLYHCTAGKDRTGMSTALILYALGADDKLVMEDYLLSNKYIEAKFAKEIKAYPNLLGLFSVKKEYLQTGLDAIKKNDGSIENFLTKKLNVDIKKMRELYLD